MQIRKFRSIFLLAVLSLVMSTMPAFADDDVSVFIPYVAGSSGAQSTISANTFADGSVKAPGIPDGYDPFNMPDCASMEFASRGEWKAPDNSAGCRAVGVETYDLSDGVRPLGLAPNVQTEAEAASPENLFWYRKLAVHSLVCPSCSSTQGIIGLKGAGSSKTASLGSGRSWSDYFQGNYLAVLDTATSITCQNSSASSARLYAGTGVGTPTLGTTFTTPRLYWELILNNSCYGYSLNMALPTYVAYPLEIYKDADGGGGVSYWTGRYWNGSTWVNLFAHVSTPFGVAANAWSAGQEISSRLNAYGQSDIFTGPNFMHKISFRPYGWVNYYSWTDYSPSSFPINGLTSTYAQSPMSMLDGLIGDYTSITSSANW